MAIDLRNKVSINGKIVSLHKIISDRKTVIAHSGHRDLVINDEKTISAAVDSKLQAITNGNYQRFVLLTGAADGADNLVAKTAIKMGIPVLLLVLPDPDERTRAEALKQTSGNSLVTVCEVQVGADSRSGSAYEQLAMLLARNADHLMVLWDGVNTGKAGGTSEVVRLAMNSTVKRVNRRGNFRGSLHQLITPRISNSFPVCNPVFLIERNLPPPSKYEWATTSFPAVRQTIPVSWFNRNISYNENFWRFLLPGFLVVLTILLGYNGFLQLAKEQIAATDPTATTLTQTEKLDIFFNAVNLISLNSSTLQVARVPLVLNIARFTGLLFVLNAFIVAFMLAIGSNNKNLLRFFFWRLFRFRNIQMIMGLNTQSYALAMALKQQGGRVVMIDKNPDQNLKAEASRRGIRVMTGSPQSHEFLYRIGAQRAGKIYILEEADADNIRILHELDQLWSKHIFENVQCYIKLRDSRYYGFTGKPVRLASHVYVRPFNFEENISRKLLIRFPADRCTLTESTGAEIFIFGFGAMGRQLLLTLLQTLHIDERYKIQITVFYDGMDDQVQEFYDAYPCIWHNNTQNELYEQQYCREIRNKVFPADRLQFKKLPSSDANLFNDKDIRGALGGNSAITFYFCLPEAMQSTAFLHSLLPKIGEHHLDLQLFCYFDIAGKSEQDHIAYVLNSQLPHTPVFLFGRLEEECRDLVEENFEIDDLAALINHWYSKQTPPDRWVNEPEEVMRLARTMWDKTSYDHKESSRRAADHIWVKLRHVGCTLRELQQKVSDGNGQLKWTTANLSKLPEIEQRRWCAEKLLNGFLPVQDVYPHAAEYPREWITRWNDLKEPAFKRKYQAQKLHIDLVPFDKLYDGRIMVNGVEQPHSEKNKDADQIDGIPYFIHVLFNS